MALTIPTFIEIANVKSPLAGYEWSQGVYESLEGYRSKNLRQALLRLSPLANLGFGLSVAEWVCWRMTAIADCQDTIDYIEALWAAMVDRRYLAKKRIEFERFTWEDKIKDVIVFVNNGLFGVYVRCRGQDPERVSRTMELVALAHHILPDKRPFDDWVKDRLKRLGDWFPDENELGVPVPRQALDPVFPYDPDRRVEYLNDFLQSLSPERNSFLAKADDLVAAGFEGTPYRLEG